MRVSLLMLALVLVPVSGVKLCSRKAQRPFPAQNAEDLIDFPDDGNKFEV